MSAEIPNTEILERLKLLRKPFEAHQISKLPKPYKADSPKSDCQICGAYHGHPALHLDYVGHAALTDRLLDVDPLWTWEPLAVTPEGLPLLDKDGGLWIKLTICGITRLGYGDAQGKTGPNATKERIGDALRNAGMRFGMALDLWHKGELHQDGDEPQPPRQEQKAERYEQDPYTKPTAQKTEAAPLQVVNGGQQEETPRNLRAEMAARADHLGFIDVKSENAMDILLHKLCDYPLEKKLSDKHREYALDQLDDTEWNAAIDYTHAQVRLLKVVDTLDMNANVPTAASIATMGAMAR